MWDSDAAIVAWFQGRKLLPDAFAAFPWSPVVLKGTSQAGDGRSVFTPRLDGFGNSRFQGY